MNTKLTTRQRFFKPAKRKIKNCIKKLYRGRLLQIVPKKALSVTAICLLAVTVSCVTVANALVLPQKSADSLSALSSVENNSMKLSGLYIDGNLIGVTNNGENLCESLNDFLIDYRKNYDRTTVTEFANSVEVKEVDADDEILSADELIKKAEGKFSVSLSTDIVYEREITFETTYIYDDNQPETYEKIKTDGKNGKAKITMWTTFVDGTQTDAVETSREVISEAVDRVIVKGTLKAGVATGTFCWPLPYTKTVTSGFEKRWGSMHNGIDISGGATYGKAIIASDGGKVIQACDKGDGYGYCVIIDHGNGYKTLYAHASSMTVSAGDYVSKGDTIAYAGSTGNSTGAHLHFEIQKNGSPVDPMKYF